MRLRASSATRSTTRVSMRQSAGRMRCTSMATATRPARSAASRPSPPGWAAAQGEPPAPDGRVGAVRRLRGGCVGAAQDVEVVAEDGGDLDLAAKGLDVAGDDV